MPIVVIIVLLMLAVAFLPQLWVRRVLARHGADRADFPGTGGEFARHLLDGMKLTGVTVEETHQGDHYDPDAGAVRLLPAHYRGRSLAAVVIAAHEVGHAMQDATQSRLLRTRTRLARTAIAMEKVGSVVLLTAPLLLILIRHPAALALQVVAGMAIAGMSVVIHLITLPVEYDASFNRALPLLRHGRFIPDADLPAARRILRAAAFTYVAAAFMSLINVARWIRVLRI